ncbi:MAG: HAMP domain-containing histidine kinase [Gammaproteobacteria bacterium]|nr:HAMP domain-containing histidine kinase [Gammaproteobacteria bacterium]
MLSNRLIKNFSERLSKKSSDNIIYCIQDVHVKELVKRLNWSVKIRWYYIAISTFLIALSYLIIDQEIEKQTINLNFQYLLIANVFLFCCNLIYQYQLRDSSEQCLGTFDLRYYLLWQIVADYLALTLVIYALGSIETPIILMIIPNTILATLFFMPRQSLLIALSGLVVVISPLVLEYFQLIPMISIFNNTFKTLIFSNPYILFGYVFILFSCVIFCWYLLCSITSRLIKNELELERSYQDMIKLDEEKSHATLRSTHELKAPLAAIKNYVYTMNEGYAGEINDNVLKIINRIGKRCDYLLNNVTDIIKLGNLKSYVVLDVRSDKDNANQEHAQFYPINIEDYINDFIIKNKNLTYEKNITVTIKNEVSNECTDSDKFIMANDENLQLIFNNLFSNAINYSHANGIIDIILKDYENIFCVSIVDQGIGIEETQLNKVFEEHYRTNNAAQFYEGGTGLGLSIVKICSQILGANINIKSVFNEGTSVTICFKAGENSYE